MTVDFIYRPSGNKHFAEKASTRYKISLRNRPIIYLSLDHCQRGSLGIGKKRRVKGFYIDPDGRIFAEFTVDDTSGHFYQYAIIGRLHNLQEEAV